VRDYQVIRAVVRILSTVEEPVQVQAIFVYTTKPGWHVFVSWADGSYDRAFISEACWNGGIYRQALEPMLWRRKGLSVSDADEILQRNHPDGPWSEADVAALPKLPGLNDPTCRFCFKRPDPNDSRACCPRALAAKEST
jgi:hypothetical protein